MLVAQRWLCWDGDAMPLAVLLAQGAASPRVSSSPVPGQGTRTSSATHLSAEILGYRMGPVFTLCSPIQKLLDPIIPSPRSVPEAVTRLEGALLL